MGDIHLRPLYVRGIISIRLAYRRYWYTVSYVLFVPFHADTKIPHVYIATDNKTFDVGEKVTLTCKIENQKPFFAVKWIREETKQILGIANFSHNSLPRRYYHKFDYIIDHVSTADAGKYTCVANYHNDSQQVSYTLKVEGKYCYHLELPLTVYLTLLYSPHPPPPPQKKKHTHTHAIFPTLSPPLHAYPTQNN